MHFHRLLKLPSLFSTFPNNFISIKMDTLLNVVNKSTVAGLKGVFLNWIQIKVKVVKQVKGAVNSSPSIKCF